MIEDKEGEWLTGQGLTSGYLLLETDKGIKRFTETLAFPNTDTEMVSRM